MNPYNGYRSWNAWNVALWINNDEGLYNLKMDCLNRRTAKGKYPTKRQAAHRLLAALEGEKTPDGARYTLSALTTSIDDDEVKHD